jgi:hypothetical protein
MANASAMEQEKGNDWHRISIVKVKHTASGWKPCVNLAMVSKGNPCAIFPHRFSEFGHLRYAHAGARPGLPHIVCFSACMPYMISHKAQHFRLWRGTLKGPIYTSDGC